ncbi:ATP-binding protein [Streptomyces sp. SID3343]|uniref:ATP-binding protein n=1 Tax=Streptomyces sp. SID3343 TaxID=2690260 RepID=UPI00136BCB6C|nr:ATP-binding protein [Streptomyces sp. SID3343]MYW00227.1 hypothetical protein [Streptomyces sp. SID3343]
MAARPLPARRRRPVHPPDADGTGYAYARVAANEYGPRAARELVLRRLIGWGVRERAVLDVVRLGVSEMVTHAARDAGSSGVVELSVRYAHGWAHVTVADASSHHPAALAGDDDTTAASTPPGQLGLYIVRRLVQAAGGRTAVTDPPGGGTELVVSLPVGRAA